VAEITEEARRLASSDTATNGSGAVSVDTASEEIVPANPDRVALILCNDHATQVIYLGLGTTAAVNQGIRLNAAGGSHRIDYFRGAVNGIATGAATVCCFVEV
jgi:hypothetical protein